MIRWTIWPISLFILWWFLTTSLLLVPVFVISMMPLWIFSTRFSSRSLFIFSPAIRIIFAVFSLILLHLLLFPLFFVAVADSHLDLFFRFYKLKKFKFL
jgi:hypothetical protein